MSDDIRLVLTDVDGTLVTNAKQLTEETIAAAAALRRAGIDLAITSGRPPRGMASVSRALALSTPLAGFNGGVMTSPDLASIIAFHEFPEGDIAPTLALLEEHGLDIWVYTRKRWMVRDRSAPHVAREASTVGFEAETVSDFAKLDLGHVIKIVGVSDDADAMAKAEQAAQSKLGDGVSATCSQPYYLDITNARANKGAVVDFLAQRLGISRQHIVTIGDSGNDCTMFARSGRSIAMGNANDRVRAAATYVTASNEQEGWAKAMHQYVLGGKS